MGDLGSLGTVRSTEMLYAECGRQHFTLSITEFQHSNPKMDCVSQTVCWTFDFWMLLMRSEGVEFSDLWLFFKTRCEPFCYPSPQTAIPNTQLALVFKLWGKTLDLWLCCSVGMGSRFSIKVLNLHPNFGAYVLCTKTGRARHVAQWYSVRLQIRVPSWPSLSSCQRLSGTKAGIKAKYWWLVLFLISFSSYYSRRPACLVVHVA